MENKSRIDIAESIDRMEETILAITDICEKSMIRAKDGLGERWMQLSQALGEIRKLCPSPFAEPERFTPEAALDVVADERPHGPSIHGLPSRWLRGKDCFSLVAHGGGNSHHQYMVHCFMKDGLAVGDFYIDGERKFSLATRSMCRCRHMAVSAANCYLKLNAEARDRRSARRHHQGEE